MGRRMFTRSSARPMTEFAAKLHWRRSLDASLKASIRSRLSKNDLKKMLAEAAQNTANLPIKVEDL